MGVGQYVFSRPQNHGTLVSCGEAEHVGSAVDVKGRMGVA